MHRTQTLSNSSSPRMRALASLSQRNAVTNTLRSTPDASTRAPVSKFLIMALLRTARFRMTILIDSILTMVAGTSTPLATVGDATLSLTTCMTVSVLRKKWQKTRAVIEVNRHLSILTRKLSRIRLKNKKTLL